MKRRNIITDVQKESPEMYARSVTMHYQPGKLDEAFRYTHESILPDMREHAGYQGSIMLFDRSTHKLVGITLWQTEADLRASGASGEDPSHPKTQARLSKARHHFAAEPLVEIYECELDIVKP